MIHGGRFVSVESDESLIRMARVAGFDTAVYGLPEKTAPILFEITDRNVLVCTTNMSRFVTGR